MAYDIIIGRDSADKEKFGDRGLVQIGKGYVKMGNYMSLSNKIYLDVARSHVILISGKRGSGKCLHEDTLITLTDGSQIPIKNLEKNKENILSINNNLKIEEKERSEFFSRQVNRLLKIKLRSGKEIKLTPEHPLLTIRGWEEIEKLTIGDRIATPRILPAFGNKEMPEHEIKLLAYLIAEGHTKKQISFTNNDQILIEDFKESLNKFDPELRTAYNNRYGYLIFSKNWRNEILVHDERRNDKGQFIKGSKNIYQKRSIRKLIEKEEIYGLKSIEKFLSQNIMQLKKEHLALFLNKLFSCDGSIYKTNDYWSISYASSSKKLIKQIQHLLIRFGILSKLRNKKIKLKENIFQAYELVINSSNALKFIEEIGFTGKKEEKQKLAREEISSKRKNPNIDTIPKEIWGFFKPKNWAEIGREAGYAYPKAMRERIKYAPSRQTLLQIAEIEEHNGLKILAESDIFWDEIISMELLEGDFTVYDICVPENHNFIANDIIVHNSHTIGGIAEELSLLPSEEARNIASLIFDTMGIFWTKKYKNEKERSLLDEWQLDAKLLPIKIFVPFGKVDDYKEKGIPIDETFAIKLSELEAEDWIVLFNLPLTSLPGVLIQRAITDLKDKLSEFTIEDIKMRIEQDKNADEKTKQIALSLFYAADTWGIFSKTKEGTNINNLISAGKTTIIDTSVYSSIGAYNIRALVISLVCRKIFKTRMDARKQEELIAIRHGQDYLSYQSERENPLVWIFIDEAHEFISKERETPATSALQQLLREGRQPGISLVLATQQPGQLHKDALTQADIVISHRVTAKPDIESLNNIMQTYLLEDIKQQIDELPSLKGSAIILDDNSERLYPMRVRPRFTWHGGEAPTAIRAELKI